MILEGGGQNTMPRVRAAQGTNASPHPFVGCEQDVLCVANIAVTAFPLAGQAAKSAVELLGSILEHPKRSIRPNFRRLTLECDVPIDVVNLAKALVESCQPFSILTTGAAQNNPNTGGATCCARGDAQAAARPDPAKITSVISRTNGFFGERFRGYGVGLLKNKSRPIKRLK